MADVGAKQRLKRSARYREDVTRWHSMIFQVFTKGGLVTFGVIFPLVSTNQRMFNPPKGW